MIKVLKSIKAVEWIVALVAFGLIFLQVYLELEMPEFMKEMTILIKTPNSDIWDIVLQGVYMMLYAFASLLSAFIVGFIVAKIASKVAARLRSKIFDKTVSFSMEEINGFSTASLITRSTNDISQVQMFISMGSQLIIKAPIMAVWAVLKVTSSHYYFSLATFSAVLAMMIVVITIIIFAVPRFKVIQKTVDDLNRTSRENLSGLRVIKAFNAEKYQHEKSEKVNDKLTSENLFVSRVMAVMSPTMSLISGGVSLAIYWIGAVLINQALLPERIDVFSDMMVFSQYAMMVIMAFMMLIMIFFIFPRAQVSARRITEVLDTIEIINDGPIDNLNSVETLEFKNVSFKYHDSSDYVLKDISFKANKGDTVAIIGATGAGKTTLINLIPRFYDVTEGSILINENNIKDYTQNALRHRIGYISQSAFLFQGTIESNVSLGTNESDEENNVNKALYIAQASDFVESLDDKEKAYVSQSGKNFSGGQKQRLSIARAVYRNPDILIFDDSFSALDYTTDRNLRNALKESIHNNITLIVAQRIGTIKNSSKIIVLDEGKISGIGTHKELLKNNKVYKEIALSQLSESELANE